MVIPPASLTTKGRVKLVRLVDSGAWTQHALARAVIAAQPTVRSWLLGRSRPEPHLREALQILTGISVTDWETDEERAHVERVRQNLKTAGQEEGAPLADVPRAARKRSGPTRAAPRRAAPSVATGTDGTP